MKKMLFAIHDRQLDAYMPPFAAPAVGAALRAFTDDVNTPDSPANKHPEDYSLHIIGEMDETTGKIEQNLQRRIALATDVLKPKE